MALRGLQGVAVWFIIPRSEVCYASSTVMIVFALSPPEILTHESMWSAGVCAQQPTGDIGKKGFGLPRVGLVFGV